MSTPSWQDRLRVISCRGGFESLKRYIDFRRDREVFSNITSPIVLDECVYYMKKVWRIWFDEKVREMFYLVARTYRIDMLEVFFQYITWKYLMEDNDELTKLLKDVTAEGATDVVVFLLEKEMPVNIELRSTGWRTSFLGWACSQGKIDIVRLLLERDANVNALNSRGETPVFDAMKCGDVRVLDHLIMHGADVYRHNNEDESLWFAVHPSNYKEEMQANFQRLADMRLPIDVKMYRKKFYLLKESHRMKMKPVLDIMHVVMESQGVVFTPWGSIVSEGTA